MDIQTQYKAPTYFHYWGKANSEDEKGVAYHLLPYHCLDVAAVGKYLLQTHHPIRQGLTLLTGLKENELIRWCVFFSGIARSW